MKKTTLLAKQGNSVFFKSWYSVFLLLLLFVCSNTVSAQITNYSFTQTAATYAPISGGTVLWSGYDGFDDQTATVTLPNSFVYQGVTYTSVFVSANGYVLFGSTTTTNTPISAGRNAVAAFAADLDAKAASAGTGVPEVRWEQVNNEFVLQWANVCRYAATGAGATSAENLNFQIRLNTSTGAIKIVYGACVDRLVPLTSVYPQVGLGGGSTTVYSNRTILAGGGDWINSTAGTANNNTMAFNGTTVPSDGLTYTWTPPTCIAPSGLTSGNITLNSATISWTASVSVPANGYEYEVRTSGTAGSGATGLFTSGTTNGLTLPLSGLSANTAYTYYVRADCGSGDYSTWASASLYTGHCIPSSTSGATYINNFSTTGGSTNISNLASGYTATGYQNNYDTATVSQYPTGTINFASDIVGGTVGTSIWVDWNNDLIFDNATERVFVTTAFGGNQTGSFVVPNGTALGDYRMRIRIDFNAIAPDACASTNLRTEAEDYKLTVVAQPACLAPSGLSVNAVTAFTATLNWTASVSTPSDGYDYYYSTSNTAPTSGTAPTGSVGEGIITAPISGLTPSTDYFVWVRSNCGSNGTSDWTLSPVTFKTLCDPPVITGTASGSVCGQGTVNLSATSNEGTITWYANQTGGTALATGENFTTPSINATTSYWVQAATGTTQSSGKPAPPTTATGTSIVNWGIVFNATESVNLQSVSLYSTTAGTVNIKVTNAALTELYSTGDIAIAAGGTTTPNIVPLNFTVPAGTGYRILVKAYTGVTLIRDSSTLAFPYIGTDGIVSVTSSEWGGTTTGTYYYFYDLKYNTGCTSARTEVVATVATPPAITLSTNSTAAVCSGESTSPVTITTGGDDYDTYVWSPTTAVSGDASNGWVFNPTATASYTLTATQSTGALCLNTANVTVNVNQNPVVTASASNPTICEGSSTMLTALTNTSVPGSLAVGTATTLTGATTQPTAFCNRWAQYWNQTVFTAAELQALGLRAGNINSIAYEITTLGSGTNVTNFSVRIGTTTNSTMTTFVTTGLTTVYGPATYAHAVGVNTITFDTPYVWDGVSNIIVDIRQNGADSTNNAITYYTATTSNMTVSAITSTTFATNPIQNLVAASTVTPALSLQRLNVVFGGQVAATGAGDLAWTWNPGALTGNSVTVTPTTDTTYTVRGTNTTTGCYTENTVAVVVNAAPAPTGNAVQTIEVVDAADATVADLVVVGNDIAWYASEEDAIDDVNPLALTTQLISGATYYAVNTSVEGCRSVAFAVTVTVTLGNTSFDLAGLKLYPNPTSNELNVEYTTAITSIEVYNLVGQRIAAKNVNAISTTVDMSHLANGTYFVKVQAENASRTIKVMKN
ncbi:GEVED domain-containing protein [Flavobacterium sp.]|uniref:GEVED domain-containing protein n=1 Tax=Flavobacterium sp. TaxID=239 RepID=UPI00391B9B6B